MSEGINNQFDFFKKVNLDDDGNIGVSLIGDSVLDNRIIVNQLNFATTICGVIDSTKEYFLDGIIDIGGTQITIPVNGINIKGYTFDLSGLTSSVDNYSMFVSETSIIGSGNVLMTDLYISVSGVNSKVYGIYDSNGFHAIECNRVNYISCSSLGDIHNYRQGLELGTGRFGGSPSLTLHGNWVGGFRISTSITRNMSDTTTEPLFKAGTLFVMNSRFLTDMNVDLGTLQPLLDFSSTNFPNPSSLELVGMLLTRDGLIDASDSNITPNIAQSSLSSSWINNHGVHNTFVGGKSELSVEVQTVITTQNTSYPILGTQNAIHLQHFDAPSNAKLRFLGTKPTEYTVAWDFVLDGQQNSEYKISLCKDVSGTKTVIHSQTRVVNNLQGGRDVAYYSGASHQSLHQNDITYWEVTNLTGTGNCTLEFDSTWTIDKR